jgi:hypothetical protein
MVVGKQLPENSIATAPLDEVNLKIDGPVKSRKNPSPYSPFHPCSPTKGTNTQLVNSSLLKYLPTLVIL